MTDQFLRASEALLGEGHSVVFHPDLQRVDQAAGITADRTSLSVERPYVIYLIEIMLKMRCTYMKNCLKVSCVVSTDTIHGRFAVNYKNYWMNCNWVLTACVSTFET